MFMNSLKGNGYMKIPVPAVIWLEIIRTIRVVVMLLIKIL